MHYPSTTFSVLLLLIFSACQSDPDPQVLVQQAIEAHGGDHYDGVRVSFDFRDRHYEASMNRGQFTYERSWQDSLGKVRDVLTNQEFVREIDGEEVHLTEEDEGRYANSINSVIYFALLPYALDDPAVNTTYLGLDTIKQIPYHKVRVAFDQEGGGEDFEDVYVYWFHQEKHTMDYLAYEFHVNEGGTRFREAYNVREVNGIRFADYVNYTDTLHTFALEEYGEQFEAGFVQELSRIDLKNIEVEALKKPSIATRQP